MGQLVNGVWTTSDVRVGAENDRGEFLRKPVTFRNHISKEGDFKPESGRYHLYVSFACPWAHRTLIMRALKGLENHITFSAVSPLMLGDGWTFKKDHDQIPDDPVNGCEFLREIYLKADPKFSGKVTVPVLWDKKTSTIVNNESSEIIRIFNSEFNEITKNTDDYYPDHLRLEIDSWNEKIYHGINNGVYRCGFARTQEAYDMAFKTLFDTLEEVDTHLEKNRFLVKDQLTEADIRLFPTLLRFDPVYHTHFKCNGKLIREYKNLPKNISEIRQLKGVEKTINMDHIKYHYYFSHESLNPSRIVPRGPI